MKKIIGYSLADQAGEYGEIYGDVRLARLELSEGWTLVAVYCDGSSKKVR